MRGNNKNRIATVLAVLALGLLSGCGGGSGDGGVAGIGGGVFGGPGGTIVPGGCAPITQPFSFRIDGAYFDSANLVGGRLPYTGTSIGQSGILGTGQGFMGQYMGSNWQYGTVSMNITQLGGYGQGVYNQQYGQYAPYQGYPQYAANNPYQYQNVNPNQVTALGTVTVSPTMISRILSEMSPYAYGAPGYYQPGMNQGFFAYPGAQQMPFGAGNACVSHVALNIGHSGLQLYGGQVFLYMNGTANGYVLQF